MENSIGKSPPRVIYEEGIDVGRAEGIDVGRAEGIDVGRAEGIDVGREEMKREMVRSMLALNMPVKTIAEVAHWSEEDVLAVGAQ